MSVYFATSGRYMKIGYSADPLSRISTITRNGTRPDDVPHLADTELIGWVPGGTAHELDLHARFASERVAGEWFVIDEAVVRDLIWSDPCGVDVQRMSAIAVFMMGRDPGLTRDAITAAGYRVEGRPLTDALTRMSDAMTAARATVRNAS